MLAQQKKTNNQKNRQSSAQGTTRRKPGSTGQGEYYHIEVLPKTDFVTFRTQDVGKRGHIQRVAGKRTSGYWSTVKWLIDKDDAHVQGKKLVPDTKDAKKIIAELGSEPVHVIGDRFKARPRPNIPEQDKPTPAQKRARSQNIKKAQAARKN
jgi:hypothetical protein